MTAWLDFIAGERDDDVMLCQLAGNLGDKLIDLGTDVILRDEGRHITTVRHAGPCPGTEDWHSCTPQSCPVRDFTGTLLIQGGGQWCPQFHDPASIVRRSKAERIVVLPSSFAPSPHVSKALRDKRVVIFAREQVSFDLLGRRAAGMAPCPSFAVDYTPYYLGRGNGTLYAYRTDVESAGGSIPDGNVDVSLQPWLLESWLATIGSYAEVHTDRAHVMIAAALMGRRVRWRASAYHKVASMAQTWLQDYDVRQES